MEGFQSRVDSMNKQLDAFLDLTSVVAVTSIKQ